MLDVARPKGEKKLPVVVLNKGDVWRILDAVRIDAYRVCLTTIYACGLRLREGLGLQVPDIGGDRALLHIHGKRAKDRYVTLPVNTFIARFLQHVLPLGFTKIRYYGLLSPTGRPDLERARHLLDLHAAAAGATTSREVTLHDGSQANVVAADVQSGVDGETSRVAVVIPAVRHCPVCGRSALRLVARYRPSRAPPL